MKAPLFTELMQIPHEGEAYYCKTPDDVQIRVAFWDIGAPKTALVLQGRTEYIEKYGPVISKLIERGYSVATLDWRGQGLSDRPTPNPSLGHVEQFDAYQTDLQTLLDNLPAALRNSPRIAIAHSMGGNILAKALLNGFTAEKFIFSAPMWNIKFSPPLHIIVPLLAKTLALLGFKLQFSPGTSETPHILKTPFEQNDLTSDETNYSKFIQDLETHPELGLGGPSIGWLNAALNACHEIKTTESMQYNNVLVFSGSEETIVDNQRIEALCAKFSMKHYQINGAKHELFHEKSALTSELWQKIDAFL